MAKAQIDIARSNINSARDTISNRIADLEAANAEEGARGKVADNKVDSLYSVLDKLNGALDEIDEKAQNLTTSCETRCNGMSSITMPTLSFGGSSGGGSSFKTNPDGTIDRSSLGSSSGGGGGSSFKTNEDGTIDRSSLGSSGGGSGGYSCPEFTASANDGQLNMALMMSGGGADGSSKMIKSAVGGVGGISQTITERVMEAILDTDSKLEQAELAAATGGGSGVSAGGGVPKDVAPHSTKNCHV